MELELWNFVTYFRALQKGYTCHSLSGFMYAMSVDVVLICGNERRAYDHCMQHIFRLL